MPKNNVAGNSGMPLSANLSKLESSILLRAKRATNRNNVATEKRSRQFWNAVECEPVEIRVLNLTASEASYKPKPRSYRKTNPKKKFLASDSPGAQMSGARTAAPKHTRPQQHGWAAGFYFFYEFINVHFPPFYSELNVFIPTAL